MINQKKTYQKIINFTLVSEFVFSKKIRNSFLILKITAFYSDAKSN